MKNFNLKSVLFSILAILTVCSFFLLAQPISPEQIFSNASVTKTNAVLKDVEKSDHFLKTSEECGEIPFSLFTSKKTTDSSQFEITNYIPTFTYTSSNESATNINYYTMDEDARPYFLLSSNPGDTEEYCTSVVFKFNDPDGKGVGDNIIPNHSENNSAGYMGAEIFVNGESIVPERDTHNTTTNDTSILFKVNLQALTDLDNDPKCPMINGTDYLGGNGSENDPSARTGLYEFKIRYVWRSSAGTSNHCVFTIAFYVLDYSDYVDPSQPSPFTFENTDTFMSEGKDTNYEVFNYNYLDTPIVTIDATKFGFSFTYTSGYTNYIFKYKNFLYKYTPDRIKVSSFPDGTVTGSIIVELRSNPKLTYTINTELHGDDYYLAKLDVRDFEQKFLIPNGINTTFQGTYSFNLDFLIQDGTTYTIVDKSLFQSVPEKITNQKMVLFGYELRYFDQDPSSPTYRQDVTLKNDVTHTNFIAYNAATSGNSIGTNTGFLFDVPEYIAVTDQAPLRFHSYGNLVGLGSSYSAQFVLYDYKTTPEDEVLGYFNQILDSGVADSQKKLDIGTNIDSKIISSEGKTYTQGASISGDGIRVMKLSYQLLVPVANGDTGLVEYKSISGIQYVVFEINNTVQNLYIQSFKNNISYDFDTYTNKAVRVNIEEKPNTFYAPVKVTYSYSSTFRRDQITTNGNLNIKQVEDENKQLVDFVYTINGKTYNYYVSDPSKDFSFTNSGYYRVTIRSTISNVPKNYSFVIDDTPFANISLNKAVQKETYYVKSEQKLTSAPLKNISPDSYIKEDLYITNTGFTLSWQEKISGASSHSYVYYMEANEDTSYSESTLFEIAANTEYWLTNGIKLSGLSSAIDNYKNSYNIATDGSTGPLQSDNYFNKDGIYFFYVFDEAGNYFTKIVLIDSSQGSSLQGYWNNEDQWVNTFDPVKNPNNYVNKDTTLYFGTHKALRLPNLSQDVQIQFEDISFTRAYNINPTEEEKNNGVNPGDILTTKPPISFAFYAQVLTKLTNYVKSTELESIIGTAPVGNYLTLKNTELNYERIDYGPDATGTEDDRTADKIDEIYFAKIYTVGDTSKYNFNKEAFYKFTANNENGITYTATIEMNFDMVQGTFYAYGTTEGDTEEHLIRKNSGTNLQVLKFEYNKLTDKTAAFYTVKTLTYDYYEYSLDDSNSEMIESNFVNYPYITNPIPTNKNVVLVDESNNLMADLDSDRSVYIIDPINVQPSGLTKPGKYILTRTYTGGTHNYIGPIDGDKTDPTLYEEVGTGGKYYFDTQSNSFIDLFELDSLIRKYIVYVDHYGIITSTYMVREDGQQNIREVGDKISISLSDGYDEEWTFKEFFLTSAGTLTLDTNKVPVTINIPLSKYFVYFNAIDDSLYSNLLFAKLKVYVYYSKSVYSEWIEYKIDGYDGSTGLCTCSKLISSSNPMGTLTFSAAGSYKIVIKDGTGYSDPTVHTEDADNLYPTTYEYAFEISHTSPYADIYTYTYNYQKDKFEDNLLLNEDGSTNFATNIKKQNDNGVDNNEVYVTWSDPITPYSAKTNQLDIEIIDNKNIKTISIDLKKFNLYKAATENNILNLSSYANSSFIIYLKVEFYEGTVDEEGNPTPAVFDNENYFRYTYTLSVDITKEYVYNITLSYVSDSTLNQEYIDNNGNSFAESLYKLSIDRTKPNSNITTLMNSEDYLKQLYNGLDLNNFKEEKFDVQNLEILPSTFTYTFGVSNQFMLNYDANDTASYFYVRSYNKYDDQYISITPDMVDTVYETDKAYYSDFSTFNINYPRFTEVSISNNVISIGPYDWYRINYSANKPLINLITEATYQTNPTGFYEIIEKDLAGNYRCYTVYFTEFETDKNFLILAIDGYHKQGYTEVVNDDDNNIEADFMFELTEISTKFGWGKINVKNETVDKEFTYPIVFTPFDNYTTIQNRLTELNEFFTCDINSRYSITLNKYNASFPSITRYINIFVNSASAKLPAPTVEEVVNVSTGSISYNLNFPVYSSKSIIYIENLTVNILQGNVWQNLYYYEGKTNIPSKIEGLQKGIYQAIYKDNYNDGLTDHIIYVGEYYINNFDKEYKFEYSSYAQDPTTTYYYSGGNIDITYEANIFTVWVNGRQISGDENLERPSDELAKYNCKTFTLTSDYSYYNIPAESPVGGETYYEVVYRDVTSNQIRETYTFIIFNVLPKISLKNAYGGDVASTLQESSSQITSSIVHVDWDDITGCEYEALNDTEEHQVSTAILYTKNQNGEYRNGVIISKGQTVSEEGYYKLQIKNSILGNYREIYFVIQKGNFPLYTVTLSENKLSPSTLENLDLTSDATSNLAKLDGQDLEILIKVLYSALSTQVAINASDFDSLKDQLGFAPGYFDPQTVGICSLTNIPHYYSIEKPEIVYNSNIELNIVEFCFKNEVLQKAFKVVGTEDENPTPSNVGSDYWTTIYLVYNLDGPIKIEFFAVTRVPKTKSLLNATIEYLDEKSNSLAPINFASKDTTISKTLSNAEILNSDITLVWNKLPTSIGSTPRWYNQGNLIYLSDKYGVATEHDVLDATSYSIRDGKELVTSTITGSGTHNLMFKDWAGNTHEFASNSYAPQNYYMIYLIDAVVYHINYQEKDYNAIQYGVFNNQLSLVIDKEYLSFYDKYAVTVYRNGNLYNKAEVNEEKTLYTFKDSGRYVVQITGSYNQTGLNPVLYNFTILDKNSARLAYEFVEIPGYEILQVIRNNEDITDNFRDKDGKIKSLFLSSSLPESGNGLYTITLKYGKKDSDTLTYSFSINNYVPTITCNVPYGETTTGSIIISYNPSSIYEQLGECYIKVLTYNNDSKTFYNYTTITINENSFTDSNAKSFEITRSNSYFIQVETKSGNTISSFRVNKEDPLNTIAIIIIAVAVVAVIVLIIVVVKLRTKMKVR